MRDTLPREFQHSRKNFLLSQPLYYHKFERKNPSPFQPGEIFKRLILDAPAGKTIKLRRIGSAFNISVIAEVMDPG